MATSDQPQRELPDVEFRRFWQRLQSMGLNAYEARSYLVLVGHSRFKALELAARAHVPRQKIYEVLDSLVEKGFAQVIQEKTKLFSAVSPNQAIPSYLARRQQALEQQLNDQSHAAQGMVDELMAAYSEGQGGRGISGVFAAAVRGRSPRCGAGDFGARAERELPRDRGAGNS
jgi:sugar-specific transcriptional regulator TrmB